MKPYKHPKVVDLLSDNQDHNNDQIAIISNSLKRNGKNELFRDNLYGNGYSQSRVQERIHDYSNRTKQTMEIYEFLRKNNIIGSKNNIKISRCKICCKKVENDNNKFKCQKCQKSCHISCLENPNQCPRCMQKQRQRKIKMNTNIALFSTRQKMQNSHQKFKQQKNEQFLQSIIRASENVIDAKSIPDQFRGQVVQFCRKYYKYLNQKGDIILPIEDHLIGQYAFLSHMLTKGVQSMPDFEKLPAYFGKLVDIWNFFSSFQTMMRPREVCQFSLQTFQQAIKTKEITYFITPLLQLLYQIVSRSANVTNVFRVLDNIRQINMFQYVSKYFWTSAILQLIQNANSKQNQIINCQQMIEKLKKMKQMRIYSVNQVIEKIQILYFLVVLAQNSYQFRNSVNEYIRLRSQQSGKATQIVEEQREKIKQQQQQNAQNHIKVVQKIGKIKVEMAGGDMRNGKQKIEQLQKQKSIIQKLQDQLRQQLKALKEDSTALAYLLELGHCNKISYLGKDRRGIMYWFVNNTQADDIIFVNRPSVPRQKQTAIEQWGFYHGTLLEQLIRSLNPAGFHQSILKANIQKLISLKIIQINSSRKIVRARQILKTITNQIQDKEPHQDQSILAFLNANLKQVNLSQLRKLLIQSLRVFNIFVRRQIGIWEVNQIYESRTKTQKFKNLNEIKQFVVEFGTDMYGFKQSSKCKKNRGREKRGSELWVGRPAIYSWWKKALQASTKNSQVFMLTLILYLQVVHSTRDKKIVKKMEDSQKTQMKKISSFEKSYSGESSSQNKKSSQQQQSWSGSRSQLMQESKQSSV